jgi:predicted acylesterase/phospholipase RssA
MSLFSFLFALALLCSLVSCGSDGKCRGLVFSGGGDRGAYEAGIVQAFVENLSPIDVQYDIISGTSAGSLNVGVFGIYPIGEEKNASDLMLSQWNNITKSNVYKEWPFGFAQGLFLEKGLYDTTPQRNYINSTFQKYGSRRRDFSIALTNAMLAAPERFNESMTQSQDIMATMASSAFPVFFPHIQIGDYPYVDGYPLLIFLNF